jgi:hypothetical protein
MNPSPAPDRTPAERMSNVLCAVLSVSKADLLKKAPSLMREAPKEARLTVTTSAS